MSGGKRIKIPKLEIEYVEEHANDNIPEDVTVPFLYPIPKVKGPAKVHIGLVYVRKSTVCCLPAAEEHQAFDSIITTSGRGIDGIKLEFPDELDVLDIKEEPDQNSQQTPSCYNIEFTFDCDKKCAITIHYFCVEKWGPDGIILDSYQGIASETYCFQKGINQIFSQPGHCFNPLLIPEESLTFNPINGQYPIIIHCVVDEGPVKLRQSITTFCSIEYNPHTNRFGLNVEKQKYFIGGRCFSVQGFCSDAFMVEK